MQKREADSSAALRNDNKKAKSKNKGEKQVLRFAKDDKFDGYAVAS